MSPTEPSARVARAILPEVLFLPDVAAAFQCSPRAARRLVLRGECGPFSRIGRRIAVRRESFLASLAAREVDPQAGATPRGPRALGDRP